MPSLASQYQECGISAITAGRTPQKIEVMSFRPPSATWPAPRAVTMEIRQN